MDASGRVTTAGPIRLGLLLAALAAAGCGGVNRRFVVESNVPNAQVYIDNRPVGAAPSHSGFEYYGFYTITVVHPGYETQTKRVHVTAPWYSYPPFDLLAEFWPFGVEDVRRYYFELCPAKQTRTDELVASADALRQRGWALPVPPPDPRDLGPPPTLGPPVAPAPPPPTGQPLPPPTPLPGPGPAPGPSPGPPPGGSPPLVPSVLPSGYTPATPPRK